MAIVDIVIFLRFFDIKFFRFDAMNCGSEIKQFPRTFDDARSLRQYHEVDSRQFNLLAVTLDMVHSRCAPLKPNMCPTTPRFEPHFILWVRICETETCFSTIFSSGQTLHSPRKSNFRIMLFACVWDWVIRLWARQANEEKQCIPINCPILVILSFHSKIN